MVIYSKIILLFIFLSILYLTGYSQVTNHRDTTAYIVKCQSSLSYPRIAQDNGISGTVMLLFDIDSNCRVVNIRVEKGIGFGCDEEAVKALKNCKPVFIGSKRNCIQIYNLRQPFTFMKPDDD